ncbi:transcriptional regulator [Desulfolithobacter dissulfuricans]|uniref:Transcriptional regulator n=1 Tax=Desulfolithobacter dissulfuricans TaxID=2795293 RepID=A0A915XGS9_9BACT|nr:Crp/Fnr family transcriptional regulator [Desulfolithobacter dissulfuricans]BCO07804.1 transcriptional regulator [Desulfolithobacter dissulfuricans]
MKTKMSSINLLQELKQEKYRPFLEKFTRITRPAGQLLFSPGDADNLVFIVSAGRLRIYLGVEDKEFSLAVLEPGDIYTTHTRAYVQTLTEVTLLTMPTDTFHAYMSIHPALSRTIISILGELLKQSFSIIYSLVFKDISQRLTDLLVHEALHNGEQDAGGIRIRLDLTMGQLAAIVGSSRQTVSTIIGEMLRSEVILREGRGIFLIPNLELLKAYPNA